MSTEKIQELSREKLIELLNIYAKNWLAHDGCWFLSVEDEFDMDTAIAMDTEAWRKFTVVEAGRLIRFLNLGKDSGVSGLGEALKFRLYSTLNEDRVEILDDKTLRYYVKTCRVQSARRRKKLPDFPCKSVGIVEYGGFARTIDQRFETECISCPPEITDQNYACIWEFELRE